MPQRHLIFCGLLFSLIPTAGLPEQHINVQIVNDSQYEQRVEVVDNMCHLVVLEKLIDGEGMIPAEICSSGMDKADVTIRNLDSGSEQRYQDVHEGDSLEVP
jgi:hypothetical protein